MPNRVVRQFGYEQKIPRRVLAPRRANRPANATGYNVQHDPSYWIFEEGDGTSTFRSWARARVTSAVAADYMDWYIPRTHPRLIRHPHPVLPLAFRYDDHQAVQQMACTLSIYYRDAIHTEVGHETDDLRSLADICDRMMPRFHF